LKKPEKCCDTCLYSYVEYNSPNYTHDMFMEDWDRGYCRFWAPQTKKGQRHEK